jgi:tRNA(His) guanylyltransferase
LPNTELAVDYFRWRNEDAHRNALNSHCYWLLRKKGEKATAAANFLNKKAVAKKMSCCLSMASISMIYPTDRKEKVDCIESCTKKKVSTPN